MKWLTGHKGGSINRAGTTGGVGIFGVGLPVVTLLYRYGVPLYNFLTPYQTLEGLRLAPGLEI